MHPCAYRPTELADPRFEGDEFTQAAITESRHRAAVHHHAHALLAVLGGLFVFGLVARHRR